MKTLERTVTVLKALLVVSTSITTALAIELWWSL